MEDNVQNLSAVFRSNLNSPTKINLIKNQDLPNGKKLSKKQLRGVTGGLLDCIDPALAAAGEFQ
ncbi:hypothetical protein ODZ84_03840 [Chryseobacterium fluminis]|uniref:hypothetical protein n=1 Tax=Chryseobacterium fluminis TaxID=2983606 RepID=UPI0022592BD2|nr:hypothetical protein [Chryseobacterium sp. MMS21-Ot14]UZT98715.1 hypothetical protein ODZ84_03840 [Chryseobacterium sp. MMS21-Ot14]